MISTTLPFILNELFDAIAKVVLNSAKQKVMCACSPKFDPLTIKLS
jgi:hypothetical protein